MESKSIDLIMHALLKLFRKHNIGGKFTLTSLTLLHTQYILLRSLFQTWNIIISLLKIRLYQMYKLIIQILKG